MFSVEIKNDTVTDALNWAAAGLEDMTPAFEELGQYMVMSTKERFAKGVSPEGVKWAPKSPTTLARYGARKSNRVDVRPLFGPSGALSSIIFHEAGPDQVEWGSPMIYAAVQQFGARKGQFGSMSNGASIPWGDIPARPFLGISPEDEGNMITIIEGMLSGLTAP